MTEVPDPDWFFAHVLDAAVPRVRQDGPATDWRRWWLRRRAQLRTPIGRAAARSGMVVTRRGARALGATDAEIRREVARGRWTAVAPGVIAPFALPDATDDRPAELLNARRLHALRATGAALGRPGQGVSGLSAAVLHGLSTMAVPAEVELTAAAPRTMGRHGRALVRGATLPDTHVTSWFGAPVTTVARTVVDVARHDRRDGLVVADAALRERLTTARELADCLALAAGWPGARGAREVVGLACPLAESALESVLRLALHDAGFPPPTPQAVLGRWRVDLFWPEQRLVLEADGRGKYRDEELWEEKKRERALVRLGYRVERVTWADVVHDWPQTCAYLWQVFASSPR